MNCVRSKDAEKQLARTSLSVASVELLSNDLWLTGHELEPGVEVLDGLFCASEVHPIMDFRTDPDTADNNPPDFQQLKTMNILVHSTKKKASIGHSIERFPVPMFCSADSRFQRLPPTHS